MKTDLILPAPLKRMISDALPSNRLGKRIAGEIEQNALDVWAINELLTERIWASEPFNLARPGGTESEGIRQLVRYRLAPRLPGTRRNYSKWFRQNGPTLSGIIHENQDELDLILLNYLSCIIQADIIGYGLFAPGVLDLVRALQNGGKAVTEINNLEPFLAMEAGAEPWTQALAGKAVLVIHPFAKSIESQYSKRNGIETVRDVLPAFDIQTLCPPDFLDGDTASVSWQEAMSQLTEVTNRLDFDIAIIGAGSFGLPLSHQIKLQKRKAINLGGSVQLLFGIAGRRWEAMPNFSKFFGEGWVRPLPEETPKNAHLREGGIYW